MGREGITGDSFKEMMAGVAATVMVVTAFRGAEPLGMTVSAFTSVSVDPPIVLWCVDKVSASLEGMLAAEGFTVNFLPEGACDVATAFASRGEDKFGAASWSAPSVNVAGPVLDVSYGAFECVTVRRIEMGDHWVLFGRVDAGGRSDAEQSPLVYLARRYVRTSNT